MKDHVADLYRALVNGGYDVDDLGGSIDGFREAMSDSVMRKEFYDWVGRKKNFRLPDYDTYESALASTYDGLTSDVTAEEAKENTDSINQFLENRDTMYTGLQDYDTGVVSGTEQRRRDAAAAEAEAQAEAMRERLQADGTIDRMKESKNEARRDKLRAFGSMLGSAPQVSSFGVSGNVFDSTNEQLADVGQALDAGTEYRQNKLLQEKLDVALDMARAGENQDGLRGVENFGLGLWDSATRLSTWDFGASDIVNNLTLQQIVEKWENDPSSLTATEQKVLEGIGMATAVQELYSDQVGVGYNVGQSLPESASFMMGMALNPASGLGKSLARNAVRTYGRNSIAKNLARIGGDIAETAIMTATTGAGRVAADALERINGSSTYEIGENGVIMYGGQKDQETVGDAVLKAIGSSFIENYSEALGEYFDPLLGMSRKLTAGGLRKMNLNKWADALSDVQPSQMTASIRSLREKTKFGGIFGEIMEEEIGMALNTLFVGDNKWSDFVDLETQLTTVLSCAIMSGTLNGVEQVSSVAARRKMEKNAKNAEQEASYRFSRDKFALLREAIDQASPEGMVDVLRDVYMSQEYTVWQKRALAEYAAARLQLQYYNAADAKARRQVNKTQQELLDAQEAGLNAQLPQLYNIGRAAQYAEEDLLNYDGDWNLIDIVRSAMSRPEEMERILGDIPPREAELVKNYIYTRARMEGAYQGRSNRVEDYIDDAAYALEPAVVTDADGNRTITTAILGDRSVYVLDNNGDLAHIMHPDGSKTLVKASELTNITTSSADEVIDRYRDMYTFEYNAETENAFEHHPKTQAPQKDLILQSPEGEVIITAINDNMVEIVPAVYKDGQVQPKEGAEPKTITVDDAYALQDDYYLSIDADQAYANAMAEADNVLAETTETPSFEQGDEITFYVNGEPISAEITGIDPDGKYLVQIDHLVYGLNKSVVDEYTAEELRKLTTPSSKVSANEVQNESTHTEQIEQSVSEEVADGQNIEIQPTEEAVESVAPAAPLTARERVPKDDKGSPIYEQTDADTAWDAIVEETEGNVEMAQRVAADMLEDKKAALAKLQKGKPKKGATVAEKIANEKAHAAAIAQAQSDVAQWEAIVGTENRRREAAMSEADRYAAEMEQKNISEGLKALGEPQSLEEYVLGQLAGGAYKLRWSDKENGTKGFGSHTGLSTEEMKARLSMIDNKNGLTPEEIAHSIVENMDASFGEVGVMDVTNMVIDAVATNASRRAMLNGMVESRAELLRQQARAEQEAKDAWYMEQYHATEEELAEYNEYLAEFAEEIYGEDTDYEQRIATFAEIQLGEYDNQGTDDDLRSSADQGEGLASDREGGRSVGETEQLDRREVLADAAGVAEAEDGRAGSSVSAESDVIEAIKSELGVFSADNAAEYAARMFEIYKWKTLEEANESLKQLLASYGPKLNGQTLGVVPFLDAAQDQINAERDWQRYQEDLAADAAETVETMENGDVRRTNRNSRGEIATVAIERDGDVISVDTYEDGALFEHTDYDADGNATKVTRFNDKGEVVSEKEYKDGKRKVTANYFEMAEGAQKKRKSKKDKDAQQTNQNLQEERKEGATTTGEGKSRPNRTFSISYYTQFLKELFQNAHWEERPSEEVAGIIRRHNAGKTLLARTEDERELLSALRALTNNEIQDELSDINNALQSDEYTDEEKEELKRAKNLITRFVNRGERNAVIEALTGAKLGEKLPLSKIDELFEMYNSDANVAELYARVRAIAEQIGLDFWFEEMKDRLLGGYLHSDNRVRLNAHMLYCPRMQRQGVASTIVHEMLHAVASYAVYTQKDIKLGLTPKVQLSKQVLSAANTIINIYEKVVNGNPALVHQGYDIEKEEWVEVADYGTKSVHEMLSEISNPDFRDKLMQIKYNGRSVWQRIWDAIKSMFAKSSDVTNPTAYDSMAKALDVLINEFSVDAYQKYGGLEESAMKLSSEENLRFREGDNQDVAYMDAVERGDMEAAQRMVDEAARKAMKKTKVVDKDKQPMLMSHHTDAEGFYVFDRGKIGTGQKQAFLGAGFNFSRGSGSSVYGNRNIQAYLDARKPLRSDRNTLSIYQIEQIIKELNAISGYNIEYNFADNISRAARAIYEYGGDLDTYASLCTAYSGETRDVLEVFEKLGFDSTIEYGDDKRIMNVVVFNSNQIKSADSVTYDDNGNVIPLSERFNLKDEDIRFREVYHGSGAEFDAFDHAHMGEGEGNQAFGWGTYVTEVEDIGRKYAEIAQKPSLSYKGQEVSSDGFENPWRIVGDLYEDTRGKLSEMRSKAERYENLAEDDSAMKPVWKEVVRILKEARRGDINAKPKRVLYSVEIPDDNGSNYLEWYDVVENKNEVKKRLYERLSEGQGEAYKEELKQEINDVFRFSDNNGKSVYNNLAAYLGGARAASKFLNEMGYVGIKYPTGTLSGGNTDNSNNYVIFNESDLQILSAERFRDGEGEISDKEVSYQNDPIAKWMGKPRYTGKKAAAFAERERKRMKQAVSEVSEALGLKLNVLDSTKDLNGKKAKAKGWYQNGEITVVIPNHVSAWDAVQTVLHEGVAHHGLRELFGDGFDAMLDNVYNSVSPELKARIDAIAERTGVSTQVATEEYLASLAETTNFEEAQRRGWWAKIKQYFVKMLHKLGMPGLNLKEELTDNELRYLLWRSYQNLVAPNSYLKPLGYIDDVAKQKELNVGEYAENKQAVPIAAEMSEAEVLEAEGWAAVTMQRIEELEARMAQLDSEIAEMEADRDADDESRYDMWEEQLDVLRKQSQEIYDELEGLYSLESDEEDIEDYESEREAEKQRKLYQKRIDNAYLKAVREGDWEEATDLFRQYVLSKAEDEGIVPMDYGVGYRGGAHSSIAKKVKEENPDAIAEAAYQMSIRIPKGSILVPMPSRTGNATYTVKLAEAIAKATDSEVRDVLKGKARMSVYEAKQKGIKMTPEDLGMYTTEELPKGKNIVIIDNVIDKGTTALAAVSAVKGASVVAYAYTLGEKQRAATLKLAEPVTYDNNMRIIPLSQRFNKETDDIRYRMSISEEEFDNTQLEAVRSVGIVMPNLGDAEIEIVNVPRHDFTGTGKEAIDKAKEWANSELVGEYTAHEGTDGEFKYNIDEKSVKKFLSGVSTSLSDNLGVHLSVLKKLPSVIDSSIEAEIHADYKKGEKRGADNGVEDKNLLIHRLYGCVRINGELYRVKTTLKERKSAGVRPYTYEVIKIELLNGSSQEGTSSSDASSNSISGAKLLKGVEKSYDKGKLLLDESKKVSENSINSEEIIAEVERESAALGVPVRIARSMDELPDEDTRKRAVDGQLKGYFDPRTNEVALYAPNTDDANDAKRTFLHEIVGHKGLRQLIGEQRYDKAMLQLMYMLPADVRDAVLRRAERHGWNASIAMDEYLAEQAERDVQPTWWGKVNAKIRALLRNMGFNVMLTDADVTYLLWRSRKKLQGDTAFDMATDAILKQAARKSAEAEAWNEQAFKDMEMRDFERNALPSIRHRMGADTNDYEKTVRTLGFKQSEAWQDSMRSLLVFQQALAKASGKDISDFENAYMYENRMSSANLMEMEQYRHMVYNPLLKEIHELEQMGASRESIINYLFAKSGLERNEVFARRDAKKHAEGDAAKEQQLYDKYRQKDYAGLTALTRGDAQIAALVDDHSDKKTKYDRLEQNKKRGVAVSDAGLKAAKKEMDDARKAMITAIEADAQRMVDEFEAQHNTDNLWDKIRNCTHTTLNISHDAGIMSDEVYNELWNQFQYYIPLRGFAETTAEDVYLYLGGNDSPYNAPIKTAYGRTSLADDPIATIGNMAESAIVEANRNRLKQRFLYMVERHNTDLASISDVWLEYDEVNDEWHTVFAQIPDDATPSEAKRLQQEFEDRMKQLTEQNPDKYANASQQPNIPYRVVKKGDRQEHHVIVKRNGKDVVITINGNPRVAQAINGLTNPEQNQGMITRITSWINRNLSANFTMRNPAFMVSNFVRDGFYTNSMAWVKENPAYAWQYNKNWLRCTAKIMNLVSRYKRYEKGDTSALDMNNDMDRMFYEFMINGGETGYTVIKSIEDYKGLISGEMKKMEAGAMGTARRVADKIGDVVNTFGRWAEDTSRFAAYMTSRQLGRTITKSIWDAKEISVNFNKKGSGNRMMGKFEQGNRLNYMLSNMSQLGRNLYVFWNAGVQGFNNFKKAAKDSPAKFTAMAGTYFTLGVIVAAAFSGDDDEDDYYNLPEYVRRNNICFKIGKGKYATLPLPIEIRAIYGLGELAYSYLSGREGLTHGEAVTKTIQQMTQVMPIDMMADGGGAMALVPSAAKPVVEVIHNVDWTGRPIYKENTPWNQNDPTWTLAFKSTNPELVKMSRRVNEWTNKNTAEGLERSYNRGWADNRYLNNPAVWEHIAEGYLGGMATMFNQSVKSTMALWNEDLREVRNVPIVSRFVKDAGKEGRSYSARNEYYEAKNIMDSWRNEMSKAKKEILDGSLTDQQRVNAAKLRSSLEAQYAEAFAKWKELDKQRDNLEKVLNTDISDQAKEEARKSLDDVMMQMATLVDAYR